MPLALGVQLRAHSGIPSPSLKTHLGAPSPVAMGVLLHEMVGSLKTHLVLTPLR